MTISVALSLSKIVECVRSVPSIDSVATPPPLRTVVSFCRLHRSADGVAGNGKFPLSFPLGSPFQVYWFLVSQTFKPCVLVHSLQVFAVDDIMSQSPWSRLIAMRSCAVGVKTLSQASCG